MIRVVLADDHPVVREGLRRIIADQRGMVVVGDATSGDEVVSILERATADVLLLDVSMPGLSFLEVIRTVRSNHRALRVLVVSMHPEEQLALRALRAGASGYLTKSASPEHLVAAIRKVVGGGRYVSDTLAEKLVHDLAMGSETPPHESLSDREYEVLCLLGSGLTVKDVALKLSLSPKTVSTYRSRLLEKMRASSNADLVKYAAKWGLMGG